MEWAAKEEEGQKGRGITKRVAAKKARRWKGERGKGKGERGTPNKSHVIEIDPPNANPEINAPRRTPEGRKEFMNSRTHEKSLARVVIWTCHMVVVVMWLWWTGGLLR